MKKEYNVNIDDKQYLITIEHNKTLSHNHSDYSEALAYESTKTEYDHCVQRSEKLDNKIYIILTVYAFLFVLLCDTIKRISDFSFPKNQVQLALILIYSLLLFTNVIIYGLTLIQLTHLLKGISFKRFTPSVVLERDMPAADSKAVVRYICSRYNQCIDTNNTIYEKRFKKFNSCVNFLIPIVVISILLIFISNFIL